MEKDDIKSLLKRLINEANVIAPSISHFDKDRHHGQVTDEDLDFDSLGAWKIESKALLKQLSTSNFAVFSDLHKDYLEIEKDSKKYHSESIFVHKIRQLLGSALALHDSPLLEKDSHESPKVTKSNNKVFIVHGHDEAARETVARFVEKLELTPIILHEQASVGKTIIEKLEAHAEVGYAIVLLTPDDEGRKKNEVNFKDRARQNVILELGYFMGKLNRENVCALHKGSVEIPSDYLGVLFVPFDDSGGWQLKLAKEMKAAGLKIDMNKVL